MTRLERAEGAREEERELCAIPADQVADERALDQDDLRAEVARKRDRRRGLLGDVHVDRAVIAQARTDGIHDRLHLGQASPQ